MQLRVTQRYFPKAVYWKLRILVVHATYKETFAVTVSPKECVRCNKFCGCIFGRRRQNKHFVQGVQQKILIGNPSALLAKVKTLKTKLCRRTCRRVILIKVQCYCNYTLEWIGSCKLAVYFKKTLFNRGFTKNAQKHCKF